MVSGSMKKAPTHLNDFKLKTKKWLPDKCACRLYKTYVDCIEFVDIIDQVCL